MKLSIIPLNEYLLTVGLLCKCYEAVPFDDPQIIRFWEADHEICHTSTFIAFIDVSMCLIKLSLS